MKEVSTTASSDVAGRAIRETYSGLVHPRLLDRWVASPAGAPGRQVSSPWPERIEVRSSSETGDNATVSGEVVEATSTGEARRIPVEIQLERSEGAWLITAYEEVDAVAIVRHYYDAIASRDFERVYRYWGSVGPPGQTLESFAERFADTASVEAKTGTPSRVEGAAGSRYVEVPVTILATTKSGEAQRFEGTYTLRRAVVDGAPAADREWHIHRAQIRASS